LTCQLKSEKRDRKRIFAVRWQGTQSEATELHVPQEEADIAGLKQANRNCRKITVTLTVMQRFEYTLFADYFQFYLQDESAEGDLSNSWTQEATDRLLAVAPGTIGVGTVRDTNVSVVVEISDSEPGADLSAWDYVIECTVEVLSGRVVIAGCTDYFPDAARIELAPGPYRARIYYGDLNSLSEDGLDGDDHYRVVLWRAAPGPVQILKQRRP
jgi:hypothetical protein